MEGDGQGIWDSFGDDANVLQLIVVMIVPHAASILKTLNCVL
jgi:hypothetical protein